MIRKLPFDNFLICEILRLGWNCLNSAINFLQFQNSSLTPLRMTRMVFLWFGLGRTGVLEVAGKSLAKAGLEA